jgi:ATPase subunit of ABC transporter with duplicated ATPase domains
MPASLHARSLALTLGRVVVLDDIELQVTPGRRIGLVGPNGVGKSTLLRALAGLQPVDAGTVSLAPAAATVGYLPQEPERSAHESVAQFLARRTGVSGSTAALDAATNDLAAGVAGADDRYSDSLERWLALGGADFESRIGGVWADLGLSEALTDRPMAALSGGEAARVSLAALLLARYDIFLLDEPTNDLDLDGLDRLERWVLELSAGLVVVSHDREFLRRTVTHVAEFDEFTHRLTVFSGGWDAYVVERQTAARQARERYDEYADKKSNLAGRAQREREWASQGLGRAKKNPDDNDKFVRNWKISQTEQLAGKAARTDKMMERLEVVEEPREAWQLRLAFGETARSGDVVVRLTDVVARNGEFQLGPVSLTIGAGERVAIVGSNGSGKSTLLDVMLGRRPIEAGDRWFGPGVVVGELEQRRHQLGDETTLLEAFMSATAMTIPDARTLLAKFGIGASEVGRATATLSPGERTRTVLALLMANGTNCLVLDEPTNHLDLAAIEQLESALEQFRGTVLLVTHDRTLLQHVRLTRQIRLDTGHLTQDTPLT